MNKKDVVKVSVKLEKNAIKPTKAHEDDAGFDLYLKNGVRLEPYDWKAIDTGVHMIIPKGYCGLVVAKSGLNSKKGLTTTGLIDAGFTGTIHAIVHNPYESEHNMLKGQKIAQVIILPVPEVVLEEIEELPDTDRGANGFGSTGA